MSSQNPRSAVQFECPKCGQKTFQLPRAKPRRNDKLTCTECGFSDTYTKIAATPNNARKAERAAAEIFKKVFKTK